jgi:hypothetical protein
MIARNRSAHRGDFLYENAEWMREAYTVRKLTLRQMAVEAQCGMRTIARWMEAHGIPTDRSRIGQSVPKGPDSPQWRGGYPSCPSCGKRLGARASKTCRECYDRTGERNPKWIWDDANLNYETAHNRVRAQRGEPSKYACVQCARPAQQWAYDHADPDERRNPKNRRDEGPFSIIASHYQPMCAKCHKRFDMAWLKANREVTR